MARIKKQDDPKKINDELADIGVFRKNEKRLKLF